MYGLQIEEHVLKIISDDRSIRGRGGRGVFRGGRGRGRGRLSLNKAIVECFKCHKLDHFQYECPDWEKKANYAELEEEEELLLMAYEEMCQPTQEEAWFLDSGCSNHMTGNKKWFSEMEEGFCKIVKLGNDTTINVVAKGSIHVQMNGITQVISDVYFVPELKNNLLSLGQLQEKGLAILIQNGTCKVFHPDKGLIMHTNMKGNRMLYLTASAAPNKNAMCLQVEMVSEKETQLWHCRFGLQGAQYTFGQEDRHWITFPEVSKEDRGGEFITCLRTDRGGEFTSNEFEEFCKDQGICRQLMAAYTPQQNGVTERKKQDNHECSKSCTE